jgi:hypothetical protein
LIWSRFEKCEALREVASVSYRETKLRLLPLRSPMTGLPPQRSPHSRRIACGDGLAVPSLLRALAKAAASRLPSSPKKQDGLEALLRD